MSNSESELFLMAQFRSKELVEKLNEHQKVLELDNVNDYHVTLLKFTVNLDNKYWKYFTTDDFYTKVLESYRRNIIGVSLTPKGYEQLGQFIALTFNELDDSDLGKFINFREEVIEIIKSQLGTLSIKEVTRREQEKDIKYKKFYLSGVPLFAYNQYFFYDTVHKYLPHISIVYFKSLEHLSSITKIEYFTDEKTKVRKALTQSIDKKYVEILFNSYFNPCFLPLSTIYITQDDVFHLNLATKEQSLDYIRDNNDALRMIIKNTVSKTGNRDIYNKYSV